MGFIGPLLGGLLSGGLSAIGGLFGGQKSTQDSTTTTSPNYDPASLALKNFLLSNYQGAVNNIPNFNKAYETSGVKNIFDSTGSAAQQAQDILSSRGIDRTTAGAGSLVDTSQQRGKQVSNFLNQAPIQEQSNLLSTLGGAGSFLASLPVGSTSTSHTTGTGGAPLSPVAGALSGGAQGLAAALGQQTASNNLANILKTLGGGASPTQSPLPYIPPSSPQTPLPYLPSSNDSQHWWG